jgi:hypothetical protein
MPRSSAYPREVRERAVRHAHAGLARAHRGSCGLDWTGRRRGQPRVELLQAGQGLELDGAGTAGATADMVPAFRWELRDAPAWRSRSERGR